MSPARMDRLESAIRVVLEFKEAFNHHDVQGMVQLMSQDCVLETSAPAPDGAVYSGKQALTLFWQDYFRRSPQVRLEVEEIFSPGLRCVMRWKYECGGAEGKSRSRGVDIFRTENGLICEELSYVKG